MIKNSITEQTVRDCIKYFVPPHNKLNIIKKLLGNKWKICYKGKHRDYVAGTAFIA